MCLKCGYPIKSIPIPHYGKIQFWKYNWYILEKQKDRMLILTEKAIDKRSYHDKETKVTWETIHIRDYLNNEFYYSFNKDERDKIVEIV